MSSCMRQVEIINTRKAINQDFQTQKLGEHPNAEINSQVHQKMTIDIQVGVSQINGPRMKSF